MTHAEFFQHVQYMARDRYCTAKVSVSGGDGTRVEFTFEAYVRLASGNGWTDEHSTPEGALEELRFMLGAWDDRIYRIGDPAAELGDSK